MGNIFNKITSAFSKVFNKKYLTVKIEGKVYYIISKEEHSEYRTKYSLEYNKIKCSLLIEDYREASFMLDKFYHITLCKEYKLKRINPKNIIFEEEKT